MHKESKGVAIIVKDSFEHKVLNINERGGCLKAISLDNKLFIIGVYIAREYKEIILNDLESLIKRIRKLFKNAQIIIAGDFNTKPKQMLQIMNKLKLKCQPENLTTTTREQSFRNKVLKSTLDYIIHS